MIDPTRCQKVVRITVTHLAVPFFFSAAVHEHSLFAANGERIGTSYVLQEGVNVTVTL